MRLAGRRPVTKRSRSGLGGGGLWLPAAQTGGVAVPSLCWVIGTGWVAWWVA
ncbi:hypothetical protein BO71DRAFT_399126 [Aspergillus ellipticus CBS 707.79]|uniref:Uncharacterized protein n=1 Tax=Aspergillus ellipticus CBS 707.79 TaxID=1448320 RepID=A0A319E0Q2_9EURO|nr:hypothetical protein BO71DRAFT_399126 [Aspergillus ellipticus CBS 707.79]